MGITGRELRASNRDSAYFTYLLNARMMEVGCVERRSRRPLRARLAPPADWDRALLLPLCMLRAVAHLALMWKDAIDDADIAFGVFPGVRQLAVVSPTRADTLPRPLIQAARENKSRGGMFWEGNMSRQQK